MYVVNKKKYPASVYAFAQGASFTRRLEVNKANVFKVIDTLRDYKDGQIPNFTFDYNYVFYVDADGAMSGDHLVVVAVELLGVCDVANTVRSEGAWRTLAIKFAEFTGIPYDHVVELGSCTTGPLASARDVAETLFNYVKDEGKFPPCWKWLDDDGSEYEDEDEDDDYEYA